ncbi:methyltransferase-domain-containing protein [Aspergillus karnatakaensis]|uniref:25S rRNA (adenine645-N1)-methyltransferase n=1 Tax=Aspergillus karnatakaensis TaxID=1810916 RepID=UPI003CCD4B0D
MFAVPGWSVSASALKQQSLPTQAKPQANESAKPNVKDNAKSNKRKRDDHVTKKNVDSMYRQHIEGSLKPPKPWEVKRAKAEQKFKDQQADASKQDQDTDAASASVPETSADGQGEGKASKKRRRNKKKGSQQEAQQDNSAVSAETPAAEALPSAPPRTAATLTPLQQAMRQKLISSRFRHLNETLYTTPSEKALELFTTSPELFEEYHAGFSRQVKESWPSNPVDGYITAIRTRGAIHAPKRGNKPDPKARGLALPRRPQGTCTIADLGCGDAQLHRALIPNSRKLNLKLHSFDLHAPKDSPITKADISNLPIEDGSVDVAIFCLSLMGTNWVSFVEEAWRVLRSDGKGECWVSEVKSRFGKVTRKKAQIGAKRTLTKAEKKKLNKKKKGDDADSDVDEDDIFAEDARPAQDDETDISAFVEVFRTRGFVLKSETVDKSNKMFVKMEFVKHGAPAKGKHASAAPAAAGNGKKRFIERPGAAEKRMSAEEEAAVLKPCVYKIR